jgi:hypothetical protein
MERLALLVLLVAGCDSEPAMDPLVGSWTAMLTTASAMDSQSEDWTFRSDHTATRVNVIHYNASIPSQTGCVETITYTFTNWTAAMPSISISNGTGTDDQIGCATASMNHMGMPLQTGLSLGGNYSVSGSTLTMTLNNDTETYTKK